MKILICLVSAGVMLAQQCVIPAETPKTRPTRVDYKNPNIPTDSYALAVSWSPGFCNSPAGQNNPNNRFQCVENSFGFVVHGLWAQSAKAKRNDEHPRFCKEPELLPAEVIKPMLCTMPSAQLVQDEYAKHGTCSFPNAKVYFERVQQLWSNLKFPELKGGMTTAGAIRKQIVELNKSKGMKPEHLSVSVAGGNRFSEVLVCYDKKFKLAACTAKGTPDDIEVRVAAKR